MNEIGILKAQLHGEQQRIAEIANALGERANVQPSVDYLVFALTRFEERDQALADLVAADAPMPGAIRDAVRVALAQSGTSREVLKRLEAGMRSRSWDELKAFLNDVWWPRRAALSSLVHDGIGVAAWRSVATLDADWILEERARYNRARAPA